MRIRWRGLELPSRVVCNREKLTDTYGEFHVEPFERGFGHTVGNSLRRILLSSLEGSSVTKIKIQGIQHEFSSIPGMVHLLTTATLDRLSQLYPDGRFDVRRFRPNVVVAPSNGEGGFPENEWVGRTVAIGEEVRLRITKPCGRCVMTTLAQDDLPKDPGILRTAAQHNNVKVGVYASVERGGLVRRGDEVWLPA